MAPSDFRYLESVKAVLGGAASQEYMTLHDLAENFMDEEGFVHCSGCANFYSESGVWFWRPQQPFQTYSFVSLNVLDNGVLFAFSSSFFVCLKTAHSAVPTLQVVVQGELRVRLVGKVCLPQQPLSFDDKQQLLHPRVRVPANYVADGPCSSPCTSLRPVQALGGP